MITEHILRSFLTLCETDADLIAFSEKRSAHLHFVLHDAGFEFFIALGAGQVKAGMGASKATPDMVIHTDTETFQRVMRGELNGATAALSGRLRFKGDTVKGLALQKLTPIMIRLYARAVSAEDKTI